MVVLLDSVQIKENGMGQSGYMIKKIYNNLIVQEVWMII